MASVQAAAVRTQISQPGLPPASGRYILVYAPSMKLAGLPSSRLGSSSTLCATSFTSSVLFFTPSMLARQRIASTQRQLHDAQCHWTKQGRLMQRRNPGITFSRCLRRIQVCARQVKPIFYLRNSLSAKVATRTHTGMPFALHELQLVIPDDVILAYTLAARSFSSRQASRRFHRKWRRRW